MPLFLVNALAFSPYLLYLVRTWRRLSLEYTLTCLLAVPVAAGLAYLSRHRLPAAQHSAPWWKGLWAGAMVLHGLGVFTGYYGLSGVALPLVLLALTAHRSGAARANHFLFPFSFLIFLLPLPWLLQPSLAIPLQQATAGLAAALLYPAPMDLSLLGVYVYTPRYYILVNDTCSGLHTACALLMFGIVLSQLVPLSRRAQGLILALVLPAGLLLNAARVAYLLVMGHVWGKSAATGLNHDLSAVFFFGLVYWLFFRLARRLERRV